MHCLLYTSLGVWSRNGRSGQQSRLPICVTKICVPICHIVRIWSLEKHTSPILFYYCGLNHLFNEAVPLIVIVSCNKCRERITEIMNSAKRKFLIYDTFEKMLLFINNLFVCFGSCYSF